MIVKDSTRIARTERAHRAFRREIIIIVHIIACYCYFFTALYIRMVNRQHSALLLLIFIAVSNKEIQKFKKQYKSYLKFWITSITLQIRVFYCWIFCFVSGAEKIKREIVNSFPFFRKISENKFYSEVSVDKRIFTFSWKTQLIEYCNLVSYR